MTSAPAIGEPIVQIERHGACGEIVHLVLNRPYALNALNAELEHDLVQALEALQSLRDVRVVVLRGAGRAFSAGADLKERSSGGSADVDVILDDYHQHAAFFRVWALDKVVIAAVHGYCLGGANHLAGLADLTVVAEDAVLGDPEIRFGNPLLVPVLPHLIGAKAARRMLYLGEFGSGAEAAMLGLATQAVPAAELASAVQTLAVQAAAIPAAAVVAAKRAWNYAVERQGLRRAGAINAELLGMTFAAEPSGGPVPAGFAPATPEDEEPDPVTTPSFERLAATSADDPVLVETRGPVRILTLNRPPVLNALSPDLLSRFDAEIADAAADGAIGAIVVTGVGRAFSAGIDLKIPDELWPHVESRPHNEWLMRRCIGLWDCPKPLIAAVNGYALGHACDLAAVCDFTIASTRAQFGVPEVRHFGGVAAMIYPYLMPMKLGRRFLYLGETWDAATALRAGLVTEVVAPGELVSRSVALAEQLCTIPGPALRQMKRAVNRSYDLMGLRDACEYNLEALSYALTQQDPEELRRRETQIRERGLGAFLKERDRSFDLGQGDS